MLGASKHTLGYPMFNSSSLNLLLTLYKLHLKLVQNFSAVLLITDKDIGSFPEVR